MALDRIWPNWLLFFHFLLLVLSHSDKYCRNQTSYDCSEQLNSSESSPICTLKRFVEPDECAKLQLKGSEKDDFGSINLRPFVYSKQNTVFVTAFNVTLSNISWNNAIIRYTLEEGEKTTSFCRKFIIEGNVSPEKELFYDCNIWNDSSHVGKPFTVEAQFEKNGHRSYKKLVLIIEDHDQLEERVKNIQYWKAFAYVDISSSRKKVVNVGNSTKFGPMAYRVTAIGDGGNITKMINGSTSVEFKTSELYMPVRFAIEPIGEKCNNSCQIVKTPEIINDPPSYAFMIFSVIPFLLVLAVLAFLVLVFLPTKRKYQLIGIPKPTVLIMYKANHDFHTNLVEHLANFLSTKNMEVLLDAHDIPKLNDPDPSRWTSGAVHDADVILIVSSPSCCPNRSDGIYGKQVFELMEREIRNDATKKSCRLVRLLLPYCGKDDFPERMNYNIFNIPKEMTNLINFVHKLKNSVYSIVLPFSEREGRDLLELNRMIYQTQQSMEAHEILEEEQGSMFTLDLTNDISPDDRSAENKSVETACTEIKEDSEYPIMSMLNLSGENEESSARQVNRPEIDKLQIL